MAPCYSGNSTNSGPVYWAFHTLHGFLLPQPCLRHPYLLGSCTRRVAHSSLLVTGLGAPSPLQPHPPLRRLGSLLFTLQKPHSTHLLRASRGPQTGACAPPQHLHRLPSSQPSTRAWQSPEQGPGHCPKLESAPPAASLAASRAQLLSDLPSERGLALAFLWGGGSPPPRPGWGRPQEPRPTVCFPTPSTHRFTVFSLNLSGPDAWWLQRRGMNLT